MTVAVQHRLEGLEPDNLLAFLALLGLLRALEAAELRPRVHWAGLPLRPVLILTEAMSQEAVAASSDEGCGILAKCNDFGGETDPTFGPERARELLQAAARPDTKKRAAAMDCLFSDAALDKKGKLQQPPLCSMKSGTGHQHFLQRLRDIPGMTIAGGSAGAGLSPGERSAIGGKRGSAQQATSPNAKADLPNPGDIYAALFEAWHHTDRAPAFRWDPSEDRRYSLRFCDPSNRSKNPILTVHGANRLAAVGLAALPAAPAMRRGEVVLVNISSESRGRRDTHTSWPIWRRSCSLAAIQALIAHPQMVVARPDEAGLHALGVIEVRRARRIEKVVAAGIHVNFTRAEAL